MLVSDTGRIRHMFVAAVWALLVVLAHSDAVRAEEVAAPAAAAPQAPNPPPPGDDPPAPTIDPGPPAPPDPPPTEPPPPEPAPTAPTAPTATPPTTQELQPEKNAATRWEPYEREAARTADGSLDVCSTMVFPLTFIPGVGDVVGTVGDWVCIVPAVIAVEHLGAFHGGRDSDYWQPALALVLKKVWETVLDTPIVVVTIGVLIATAAGGAGLIAFAGIPATLVSAGVFGGTLAVYLGLKAGRDAVGDAIFALVYGALTPEVEGEELIEAQRETLLQPPVTGVPAGFGLIATVAGSKPEFEWAFAVPVVGPVWRADEHARAIQLRVRRYGKEVLLEDKKDLTGVDDISSLLANVQGFAYGASHVALGAGIGLFATGLVVAVPDVDDEKEGHQSDPAADVFGGIGLAAVAVGGAAIVVGLTADKLQPVLVPAAYALAE